MVFDGPAKDVNTDVLNKIYGDEDWTTISKKLASQHNADNIEEDEADSAKYAYQTLKAVSGAA